MAVLRQVSIYLDESEQFVGASATWEVKAVVDGIGAIGGATTSVSAKPITDAVRDIIAAVIADGPQVPE